MRNTSTLSLDQLSSIRGGCGKKQQPQPQAPRCCRGQGGWDVDVTVATGGAQPPAAR
jgi:hypothetical protein